MADQRFTLKLGIGPDREKQAQRNAYKCDASDGLDNCTCMSSYGGKRDDCIFYSRPIEPLAFYLGAFSEVNQQSECPLYTVLPKEIRDMIFEYALTDDDATSYGSNHVLMETNDAGGIIKTNIACALLQSCKAVYLEAYRLPMLLNGYYQREAPSGYGSVYRPDMKRITPWQYALIQRLDIELQQVALEGGSLGTRLASWNPSLRHSGAYVAPHFYNQDSQLRSPGVIKSHNFGLTTFGEDTPGWRPQDGDEVTLHSGYMPECNGQRGRWYRPNMGDFIARGMVARPLTRLTIRMSRTDWWTWTDSPNTTMNEKQLALDPARGPETRPLLSDMLVLAAERRDGQHPRYEEGTWGAAIGALPDLRTFELVLETFLQKKRQLEVVVECAKTWRFPLADTRCELVCDGKIEALSWSNDDGWETDTDAGFGCANPYVEVGDFSPDDGADGDAGEEDPDDGSRAAQEEEEDDDEQMNDTETEPFQPTASSSGTNAAPPPPEASPHPTLEASLPLAHRSPAPPPLSLLTPANPTAPEPGPSVPFQPSDGDIPMSPWSDRDNNGYTVCSRPSSPYTPSRSGDLSSPHYSPTSPTSPLPWSPTSPRTYSPHTPTFYDWYDKLTEFEVRVVRFRRRQVE